MTGSLSATAAARKLKFLPFFPFFSITFEGEIMRIKIIRVSRLIDGSTVPLNEQEFDLFLRAVNTVERKPVDFVVWTFGDQDYVFEAEEIDLNDMSAVQPERKT